MTQWPQISVLVWLVLGLCGALGAASRPHRRVTLSSRHQRAMALGFAGAVLAEATLLCAGGFFERMF